MAEIAPDAVHTILIVDDDENFRKGLIRAFWLMRKTFATNSLEAADGAEAYAVLERRDVDCVLLDYRMPGGSGLDWIAKLIELCGNLAIVMVTGEGAEETAVQALQEGAMDYLVKGSFSAEQLQRAVGNAIEKVQMRNALEEQRKRLLEAERQRVMIESLGAACHHLGQPLTVIRTYLGMMQDQEETPEQLQMIKQCLQAADSLADVVHKLQNVGSYRTVSYLQSQAGNASDSVRIIDIDSVAPAAPPPHRRLSAGHLCPPVPGILLLHREPGRRLTCY